MTRGTLYLIESEKNWAILYGSVEFNGDMYPGGHYEEAVKRLKEVKYPVDFYKTVLEFDKQEGFNYQDEENGYFTFSKESLLETDDSKNLQAKQPCVTGVTPLTIDLNKDYFDHWFSDYIFFKITGNQPVVFIDKNNQEITVKPNEVAVFNFGKYMSEDEYKEQNK